MNTLDVLCCLGESQKVVGLIAKKLLYGSAVLLAVTGATSYAQGEGNSGPAIEEVVVTAQKREQNLQEVPASVAVISGEDMQAIGASTGLDILKFTPAIALYADQDPRTTMFTIRGLGFPSHRPAVEDSTSIIIDGENLPRSAALNMDLTDVERVEVLRGPQGTLFGKNMSAGGLHIITKRPDPGGFSGNLNVTVAEDEEYVTRASVNTVVSEEVTLRFNGFWRDMGGWISNVDANEPDGGSKESWGLRAQALFQPSEVFEVLARIETSQEDYGPYAKVMTALDVSQLTEESRNALLLSGENPEVLNKAYQGLRDGADPGPSRRTTSQVGDRNYGDIDNLAFSLEGRYRADGFDIVYLGSYRDWELFSNEDQSLVAVDVVECYFCGDTNIENIQQELRVESTSDSPINYVGGLFYNRQEIFARESWRECLRFGWSGPPPLGLPPGTVVDPNTLKITDCGGTGNPLDIDRTRDSVFTVNNYAVFANVDWRITDAVNLFAGARVLHEVHELTMEAYDRGELAVPYFERNADDTAVIYRGGAQYFFNDDVMFYASVSTGYKGKAWDNGLFASEAFLEDYPTPAEEPFQVELGFRSDLFDNRLRVNMTYFRTEIEDFQDTILRVDPDHPSGGFRGIQSSGEVRTQGVELEAVALVTDGLVLSGSFGWTDPAYTTDVYQACSPLLVDFRCERIEVRTLMGDTAIIEGINFKGRKLQNAIEFAYHLSALYEWDLASGYGASAKLAYRWQDDQEFQWDPPFQVAQRTAFGIADLTARVQAPGDRWALTFFVNNLFDNEYTLRRTITHFSGYTGGRALTMPRDYKRYLGANLSINF